MHLSEGQSESRYVIRSGRLSGIGDRRAAPREVEVTGGPNTETPISGSLTASIVPPRPPFNPVNDPKPRKSDFVKSRLRFVQFGFMPGYGMISSISYINGIHVRHDEIGGIVSPSVLQS